MLKKIKDYVYRWHMLEEGDKVIAGVSGGADSICLLFVLLELQKTIPFEIVVVHVNHGLRGAASDADEAYVKQICETHHILCETYLENVELIAKNRKQSTEEAGREVRRQAFQKTMERHKGTKIALAHHKNDNVETFFINLARGSGIKGLGGIRPVAGNVIRPLLCLERNEIEVFLKEREIPYCTDETNAEDVYTRNRIRHHIVPYLEKNVNSGTVSHIDETMERMREIQEFLEEQMQEYYQTCVVWQEAGYLVQKAEFEKTSKALRPLLLHRVLVQISGKEKDIEAVHLRQLQELFEKQVGRKGDFPYGIEAKRTYEGVLIRQKRAEAAEQWQVGLSFADGKEQQVWFGKKKITCRILDKKELDEACVQKGSAKWFDYDIIQNGVSLRTRRTGDYITIHPDGKTQKLKSYFINEKIPQEERDEILLAADGNHILWIVGHRMGEAYRISENTKLVLEIKIDEGESYGRDNQSISIGKRC